jgi:beta-lactamase class A
MTSADLEQSIAEIARLPAGRVDVSAETIDGRHLIQVNADEIYPSASSIKMYLLYTLLVKAEDGLNDSSTPFFSRVQTASAHRLVDKSVKVTQ